MSIHLAIETARAGMEALVEVMKSTDSELRQLLGTLRDHDRYFQAATIKYQLFARQVTAEYNWTHPHRKLSWRRLNRLQRAEVMRRMNVRRLEEEQ